MTATVTRQYEGTLDVYCHRITFRFWLYSGDPNETVDFTPDLIAELESIAEERVKDCLRQEYSSGELNYYRDAPEQSLRGWWEIA